MIFNEAVVWLFKRGQSKLSEAEFDLNAEWWWDCKDGGRPARQRKIFCQESGSNSARKVLKKMTNNWHQIPVLGWFWKFSRSDARRTKWPHQRLVVHCEVCDYYGGAENYQPTTTAVPMPNNNWRQRFRSDQHNLNEGAMNELTVRAAPMGRKMMQSRCRWTRNEIEAVEIRIWQLRRLSGGWKCRKTEELMIRRRTTGIGRCPNILCSYWTTMFYTGFLLAESPLVIRHHWMLLRNTGTVCARYKCQVARNCPCSTNWPQPCVFKPCTGWPIRWLC